MDPSTALARVRRTLTDARKSLDEVERQIAEVERLSEGAPGPLTQAVIASTRAANDLRADTLNLADLTMQLGTAYFARRRS